MKKKFIAYEGAKFTIEWYFDDRGKSEVIEYYKELPLERQEKLMYLFYTIADTGRIFNKEKFRYEEDQIYAFKPTPDRFLCFFFEGSKIIVSNAFEKKSQKMPQKEKLKALKLKNSYIKRCKEGTYYE